MVTSRSYNLGPTRFVPDSRLRCWKRRRINFPGRSQTMTALGMHESFGETYFGVAEVGGGRGTRRRVQVADQLLAHPGGTLPTKIQSPGDLDALYRLANRPEVTHQTVLA